LLASRPLSVAFGEQAEAPVAAGQGLLGRRWRNA